ncbi:12741_t:CDS:2 [Gigaspora rosea]|nr:12741_t:CDS:2 [Gigaspora rosea]
MAAEWYKRIRESIEFWKVKEENEIDRNKSFYHLFMAQFTPEERQYWWQMELYELQQKDTEKNVFERPKRQKC